MRLMNSYSIDRRKFLQGMGVTLALPWLESSMMASPARIKRLVCFGNHLGFYPEAFFPKNSGADFIISPTLKHIEKHRKDFTVFSNLDDGTNGGHAGVHAFLSGGIRKEMAAGFPEKNISIDQVAAEHVGSATRFPSITAGIDSGTNMVWKRSGVSVPPINNPAQLFRALFVDQDNASRVMQRKVLLHRSSVLDALRESAKTLNGKLDASDRDKLDQYLTSVREVERRLQMSREWLDKPKPKSPIKTIGQAERQHIEEMPLLCDLLALALQTDSTRVTTFEVPISFRTSELNVGGYHSLSHHSKSEDRLGQLQKVEKYWMEQFGFFLNRLKEKKVFNDTLVVLGSGMSDGSRHSNRDLPVLLAGGGIKHEGHLICPAEGSKRIPLSNLLLSTLQWFGCDRERFGKSTGAFSPMQIS
ncbi:MAG: hypothetical protein CMO71_01150 [Verrucomicrobiales bacterium]|nr:hypothetical protein [Verrucomicrobiales bacterium]